MKRWIGFLIVIVWAASGCASTTWGYEAVTAGEASDWVLAGDATAKAELAPVDSEYPLASFPAACHRKECVGPATDHHDLLQRAAFALAASKELFRLFDLASTDESFARRFRQSQALAQGRLAELQRHIDVTEAALRDLEVTVESFSVARRQLADAEVFLARAERRMRDSRLYGPLAWGG